MSFVIKRRDLADPAELQALIVEHADDLERGLTILDSRVLLGQATIDIVGVDADGALVLIAVGLVADEEMFLKAVEGYSWCLEYPEAIRRLSPTVQFSSAHPPRVMFVVERMPDAFLRKIKQLGFPEVDCVEFRHLDVDGTAAVYFDTLAKLRRGAVPTAPIIEPAAVPPAPTTNGRPTGLKLQKLLGADRPAAARESAPVVRIVPRATVRPEPQPAVRPPRAERVVAPRPPADEVPLARIPEPPRAAEPLVVPAGHVAPSRDEVAATVVAETLADASEFVANGFGVTETVVEPFATIDRSMNGHLEPVAIALEEPAPPARDLELAMFQSGPLPQQSEPALVEPDPPVEEAAPTEVDVVADVVAAETWTPAIDPVAPEALTLEDAPVLVASATAQEPETMPDAPEPALVVPVLELESNPIAEAPPAPPAPVLAVPEPMVTQPEPLAVVEPIVEPEPFVAATPLVMDPEPLVAAEPIASEPEPVVAAKPIVAEVEPLVAALSTEPAEPVTIAAAPPTPTPSVFSRRPADAAAARDAKISFAGVAKDLLPQPHRVPDAGPVSAPRASVEEITRGALDDLVGATDKRTADGATASGKPAGPFAKAPTPKRPRTIASTPSEGPPISGGPKLGTAPKRTGPAETGAPAGAEGETKPAVQGFEGLQFPNDGVLTRQWMEFLNQMAAGK